jgi:DNA-binding SARP family transcriptional activator
MRRETRIGTPTAQRPRTTIYRRLRARGRRLSSVRFGPATVRLSAPAPVTSGPTTTSPLSDDRALFSAGQLLAAGRYEDAADAIRGVQRMREAAGDAVESEILAAARRLCMACSHQRDEMNAQHHAAEAAAGMEQRLRDRVTAMLELAATRSLMGPPQPADAAADATPELSAGGQAVDTLAIQCFGPFSVRHGARTLGPWPNRRAKAVLKYLVLHREQPVNKDVLIEAFWPDGDASAARNNLNVAVHSLRRFLRDAHANVSHVVFRDGCYAIDPELQVWVDVEEFVRLSDAGAKHERNGRLPEAVHQLHAAEVLYQGALFDDDPYEEWMLARRQELQDRYVGVLERLGGLYRAVDDERACVDVARRILAVEPFREAAHRELMRCYARQGQHHLALRQFVDCARTLDEALDTRPEQQTLALYERIRHHEPV